MTITSHLLSAKVGRLIAVGWLGLAAAPAVAQEFVPPDDAAADRHGVRLAILGFSTRLGVDFDDERAIVGTALDILDVGTERVRLRPSVEIGLGETYSYVVSSELLYRFTPDTERAVPYVGFGLGVFVQEGCGSIENCPDLWMQFALGFEIRLQNPVSWFFEYHPQDALSRHRFFVGLTTRRGS